MDYNLLITSSLAAVEAWYSEQKYETFFLKKKTGGIREIDAPCLELKIIQIQISKLLTKLYEHRLGKRRFPIYGFRPNSSFSSSDFRKAPIWFNAQRHIGSKYFVNIDVEDFFPSILKQDIEAVLSYKIFSLDSTFIEKIIVICMLKKGENMILPQGSPASPVLSNIAFYPIDKEIIKFARKHKLIYTRYADDLTFSSQFEFPDSFLSDLELILNQKNFRINKKKIQFMKPGQRKEITGLVVTDKIVTPSKDYMRLLRLQIHQLKNLPISDVAEKIFLLVSGKGRIKNGMSLSDKVCFSFSHLHGKISFLKSVTNSQNTLEKLNAYEKIVLEKMKEHLDYFPEHHFLRNVLSSRNYLF